MKIVLLTKATNRFKSNIHQNYNGILHRVKIKGVLKFTCKHRWSRATLTTEWKEQSCQYRGAGFPAAKGISQRKRGKATCEMERILVSHSSDRRRIRRICNWFKKPSVPERVIQSIHRITMSTEKIQLASK